tara:strand:+ start:1825 stop:2754 length:930 start_codon:yes stop_codon:yes gene_type:complete
MSNDFRNMGSMNQSLEAQTSERMNDAETQFNVKSRSNELIKTLGEAKSAISGKGLVDKVVKGVKDRAKDEIKKGIQKAKDIANQKLEDLKGQAKSKLEDLKGQVKGKIEGKVKEGKQALNDAKKGLNDAKKGLKKFGRRGATEDSALTPSKPLSLEESVQTETDAFKTTQAASRGEQFAQEMAAARETGDVGLSGSEDALRVGQSAGKTIIKGGEKDLASQAEKDAASAAEKDAARTLEKKTVTKAVARGAKVGEEVDEDAGGPTDIAGDVIGIVAGAATTIYSAFKKPHDPMTPRAVNDESQSFQIGF